MALEYPPLTASDLPDPDDPPAVDESELEIVRHVVEELAAHTSSSAGRRTAPFPGCHGGAARVPHAHDRRPALRGESDRRGGQPRRGSHRRPARRRLRRRIHGPGLLRCTWAPDGPRLFRRYVKPALARVVAAAHRRGKPFVKHTDGNQWLILDDFVEVGVDAWHGIQPRIGWICGF